MAFPLRARFNCAGVGKSKLGEGLVRVLIAHVRGRPGTEATGGQ